MDVIYRIVSEIAEREGIAPEDLDPPLVEAVDTDALEALTASAESRRAGSSPSVEFVYHGYTVSIDETGEVCVGDDSSARAEERGRTVDGRPDGSSDAPDTREAALQQAAAIVAARERPFETRLDGLLEVVRKTLGVDSAALSYVDEDSYVFEAVDTAATVDLQAGEMLPLADTACKRAIGSEQALVLGDAEVEAPAVAESAPGVASYIGVPVFVDGEVYGTFCFYDAEVRDEAFSEWELALVELLGNWVSSELERRRRERSLHASTTERPSTTS